MANHIRIEAAPTVESTLPSGANRARRACAQSNQAELRPRPLLTEITVELKRNGRTALSLVSSRSGKSLTTLRHRFKAAMGISPREYLQRRRLHLAALLLLRRQ